MEKIEVTKFERHIYEDYLLFVHKEDFKWNATQVPDKLKKLAKKLIADVEEHYKQELKLEEAKKSLKK